MKTIIPMLMIALLGIGPFSHAQLGGLKNKLKKAVKQEKTETDPEKKVTDAKPQKATDVSSAKVNKEVEQVKPAPRLAPLAYDAPFQPAILYRSLLNGVKINHRNGLLMIASDMTASFLPAKEEGGATAFYGTKPEQHKLAVHLTKEGTTLKKYLTMVMQRDNGELRSAVKGPFADFSIASNGYAEQQGYDTEKHTFTEAGEYALEFFLDGERFYAFPFEVRIIGSDDPYASDDKVYAMEGPWMDALCIDLRHPVSPEAHLIVKKYMRVPAFNEADLTYLMTAQLKRNGKALLYDENPVTYGTKPFWSEQQLNLAKPWEDHNGTASGEHLQVNDILTDGDYELTLQYFTGKSGMSGSEQPHPGPAGATKETYTFKVKDGKIVPQGNQVRSVTPAESFVEGGREHFWIFREGSAYNK